MFELFAWFGWMLAALGWWAFSKECEESRYWEHAALRMHGELEDYCEHVSRDRAALRLVK